MARTLSIHKRIAVSVLLAGLSHSAFNLVALGALSEKVLEGKLNAAKILLPGSRFVVNTGDIEVTVSKFVTDGSKDPDKDCKIEAVMIAKTIMDADATVKRVKTQFYDRGNPTEFRSVSVGIGDVKAFGSGAISGEDLMKSLELNKGSNPNPPLKLDNPGTPGSDGQSSPKLSSSEQDSNLIVADGPMPDERKKLLGRISRLKAENVNTSPYESYFAQIEETARTNSKSATSDMIEKLSQNIESQEKALQRKKAPPTVAGNSSSTSSLPSPLPPPPDASPSQAPHAPGGLSGYSLDDLKGMFMGVMAQRAPISQLQPAPGPYYLERWSLVRRWFVLGKSDNNLFYELERDAKAKNSPALATKLKTAFAKYNVSSEDMRAAKMYLEHKGSWPQGPGGGGHRHHHQGWH